MYEVRVLVRLLVDGPAEIDLESAQDIVVEVVERAVKRACDVRPPQVDECRLDFVDAVVYEENLDDDPRDFVAGPE